VIPVKTGAIVTISESLRKHHSNIPGKQLVKELYKIEITHTSGSANHLLWEITLRVP
jgi:hypothetical protein